MVYGLKQFYKELVMDIQSECEDAVKDLLPEDRFKVLNVSAAGNGVCVVDFVDKNVLASKDCEEECNENIELAVSEGLLDESSIEEDAEECSMACEELTELGRVNTIVFDVNTRKIYKATLAFENETYDLKGQRLFDKLKRGGCTMNVGQEEYISVVPEEYKYGFEEAPDYIKVDIVDTSRTGRCTVDTVIKALRSVV
ncbi:MAG: hypothetical protein JHC26_06575 [Thermofilum sp.]|uniref:hypothetical protein n=1 Tax=Thermofilum sp. TaxID=1961369 RepID=UPI00258C6E8B|nr:hypothetical protein [Thermofilum sp.]MCI4408738.1 hypothetical protein [Thermofilum sp.]